MNLDDRASQAGDDQIPRKTKVIGIRQLVWM